MKQTRKRSILLLALLLCAVICVGSMRLVPIAAAQQRQTALNNALLAAIPNNHISAVRDLLREGADPNSCEQPSSWKEELEGNYPIARHLFHSTSQPLFMTALGMAVLNSEPEIVQSLLAAGADVQQKDNYGETALDLAQTDSTDRIHSMLKNAERHPLKSSASALYNLSGSIRLSPR